VTEKWRERTDSEEVPNSYRECDFFVFSSFCRTHFSVSDFRSGQVLSAEGLPVKQFRVQLVPLDDPEVEQVLVRDCAEVEGRFTLDFKQAGPHWLAIQAEGYAAWEKTIKVGKEPQSLDERLERGDGHL
jgi:hypothetical protein